MASLRHLYKGVTTSRHLPRQTMMKVRCTCELLMKVNISKAQNVASYNVQFQYYCLFHKTLPF